MFNRYFTTKAQFSFHSLTERRQVLIEWTLFFSQTLRFFVFHLCFLKHFSYCKHSFDCSIKQYFLEHNLCFLPRALAHMDPYGSMLGLCFPCISLYFTSVWFIYTIPDAVSSSARNSLRPGVVA